MFDVAVIGGGPAGCAAAISLAQQGISVVLLERSLGPRQTLGETVPPEIRLPLMQLGIWDSFKSDEHRQISGISSIWGSSKRSETDFIFNPYGNGWVIDRSRFDQMLRDTAVVAGARLCQPYHVIGCERVANQHWIINARCNGKAMPLRASFILKATGRGPSLPVLGSGRLYTDSSIALITFAPAKEQVEERPLVEAGEDGWWYSTLLPSGAFIVIYITDASFLRAERIVPLWLFRRELMKAPQTRNRLMQKNNCSEDARVVSSSCSRSRKVAGDGWVAIGDAAMGFDPLCGQGILNALESGLTAAVAIVDGLNRKNLQKCEADSKQAFTEHMELRRWYYQAEERWPHSKFWAPRQQKSL
jgi:flavin-dependent dehydrogenase